MYSGGLVCNIARLCQTELSLFFSVASLLCHIGQTIKLLWVGISEVYSTVKSVPIQADGGPILISTKVSLCCLARSGSLKLGFLLCQRSIKGPHANANLALANFPLTSVEGKLNKRSGFLKILFYSSSFPDC